MATFVKDWSNVHTGEIEKYASLYSAQTSTDNGEWLDMRGVKSVCIEVSGTMTDGDIDVQGSNDATIPANSSHETLIASLTAVGFTTYEQHELPRWLKVYVEDASDISANVDIRIIYAGSASS